MNKLEQFLNQAQDQDFKAWMKQHSSGFYLNERETGMIRHDHGKMILHKVGCYHLGDGEGVISTSYAKVASDRDAELLDWAEQNGLKVTPCRSCKPPTA